MLTILEYRLDSRDSGLTARYHDVNTSREHGQAMQSPRVSVEVYDLPWPRKEKARAAEVSTFPFRHERQRDACHPIHHVL